MDSEKAHILIVEDSEITLFKLKAILLRLGYNVTTQSDAPSALTWLAGSSIIPNLIISDINMPGMNGFDFVRKVRSILAYVGIPIMMLTSQNEVSDKVAGMEAGADDYLSKTVSPTELELRIKALLARSMKIEGAFTQAAAKMISVFSLRGGVGTTSVSINLAIALQQLWGIDVSLWDLAMPGGHCALFLNLKPKNSLATLADWVDSTVDDEVLARMILAHESGIKVMPAPLVLETELVTTKTIDLVLPYLQNSANYLVVDAGNHFTDPVLNILERSDKIILLMAPELGSVKCMLDAVEIFDRLGMDAEKILPVVNSNFAEHRLSLKRIASVLKRDVFAEIPYDKNAVINAIHTGEPYVLTDPKSDVSAATIALAYRISSSDLEDGQKAKINPKLKSLIK